ncbi:MAG: hypothetical protein AAF371_18545 [Pseudomonadota bacterium]
MSERESTLVQPTDRPGFGAIGEPADSIAPITFFVLFLAAGGVGSFLFAGWAARRSGPRLWLLTAPLAGAAVLGTTWIALRVLFP